MSRLRLSRRTGVVLGIVAVLAFVAFLPMRIALDIAGVARWGISAREVRGTVWDGRLYQAMIGGMTVGSVEASLAPMPLLMGRARFDLERRVGAPDDIAGAFTVGPGRVGIDDVTGAVPIGRMFAPLPLSSLEMDDVSAHFKGARCGHAQGRVRARLSGQLPGLNLSQGLAGTMACDGEAMLLSLVSQSGMERITLRLMRSGRYVSEMRVDTADASLADALEQAGFARIGDSLLLKVEGRL